ncbi:BspA family leucine-rich repeat surface protein [Enterococcus faecalis]|nr:BspA family leucine-rich repeat surface protein [Enterococcus faecalis]
MSKKKLTKKKKKQLLALFATTTMTVNMAMAPLSVLAEENESSDAVSVGSVLEENMNLPAETMTSDVEGEKESTDVEEKVEEKEIKTTESAVTEKEEIEEQETDNKTKVGTLTGSYENDGTWTFNQENGLLVLSGGTLSASIGADSWLKEIKKADVLEIQVVNAVGAEDLSKLFLEYRKVKKITFEQFDTAQVTDMSSMFEGLENLTKLTFGDFDTSQVTDMSRMFMRNSKLEELDVSSFNTHHVVNMSSMFRGLENLTKLTFGDFDTSQVTNMSQMFTYTAIKELDVSNFNTSQVTNMAGMFGTMPGSQMPTLISKIIFGDSFDTSQVTDMSHMFSYTSNLQKLDLSGFDTGKVTNMEGMFWKSSLKQLDVSNFDTRNVTTMEEMFGYLLEIEELNLSNFDTSQVTNMSYMFSNSHKLIKLDLSSFDTSNVTNMSQMFYESRKLKELDLSSFDTHQVEGMSNIFGSYLSNYSKFEKLTLGAETKILKGSGLRKLDENTFWHGEYAGNLLNATDELIEYHNALNEINTYTIINKSEESLALTFDTVGGSGISPIETKFGGTWVAPTAPTKKGYIFEGWYTDADYTKEFDFGRVAIEPLTVYAKWAEEKEETIFETDDYHIGDYNITGRFSAPIVTAQLRINGSISNKGGTFNQNDGTFYYYAGAGRIQTGQEVVLEGLDKSGNIVETVNIEPKVVEGTLSDVQHTVGSSTITGTYTGEMSKARLVVNGNIISVGGTFKEGTFSYYVAPNQVKETDTVQLQGYDKEGNPVGDLTPVTIQKQQGQLTEATYKLGQSTITGTYEGNVKKARLLVDGKQISWGGTFKEGTFSYYVAPGIIKANSTVTLEAHGEGDVLLAESFTVLIQP